MHFGTKYSFKYLMLIIVILAMLLQAGSVLAQVPSSVEKATLAAFQQEEGEGLDAEPTATPGAEEPAEGDGDTPGGEDPGEEEPPGDPSESPGEDVTEEVTEEPTEEVTEEPTEEVTEEPTEEVTEEPTGEVTEEPTEEVTEEPTAEATDEAEVEKTSYVPKFSWRFTAEDLSGSQVELVNSLDAKMAKRGIEAAVEGGKNGRASISGSGDVPEIRDMLYQQLKGKINLIGSAAEVTIEMPVSDGQAFSLNLESNLSTGYNWQVVEASLSGGKLTSGKTLEHRGGVGAPEKQNIRFEARGDGLATVRLVYRRPFEQNQTITRHLSMTFGAFEDTINLSDPNARTFERSGSRSVSNPIADIPLKSLPGSYDWRSYGVVPAVRDQGGCGSCFAFGTVGVMESALAIEDSTSVDLSEQFLVSCNNDGWDCYYGGLTANKYHFDTLGRNQTSIGAVLENDMPYTASDSACTQEEHPYVLTDWEFITGSEWTVPSVTQIKNAIYTYGPITAGICAGEAFSSYDGGVFSKNEKCGGGTNHQIILVGWDDATSSWILRNSWGSYWGEGGYMRIKYNTSRVGEGTSWAITREPAPGEVSLVSPANGAVVTDDTPALAWQSAANAASYNVQVSPDANFASLVYTGYDISGTSADSDHLIDGRYYWRVQGKNSEGWLGPWSGVFSFTLDSTPPAVPVLKSPALGAEVVGIPTFKWGKVPGAVAYQFEYNDVDDPDEYIYRSEEIKKKPLHSPPIMGAMTPYYWYVRAADAAGNWSEWSEPFTVKIIPPPPGAPTLLLPANRSATNQTPPLFTWLEVNYDGGGYQIMIDDDRRFRSPLVDDTTGEGETGYIPSIGFDDGRYYWQVRAQNENGDWGRWSKAFSFTADITPPEIPELSVPATGSDVVGTPTFKWKKVKDAVAYQFEYNDTDDPDEYIYLSDEILKKTQYAPPAMEVLTPFYWYVRAADAAGNWSEWSEPFIVTIVPPAPGAPTLLSPARRTVTNDNTPDFEWVEVNYDGGGYQIMVDDDRRFGSPAVDETTAEGVTTITSSTELPDGKYYWQVRAQNLNGDWGKWSKPLDFTVDTTPPEIPELSSPAAGSDVVGTPTFSWFKARDAVAYQFEYNDSDNPDEYIHRSDEITRKTQYTPPAMEQLTPFYWFVRAADASGNWSSWSEPFIVTIVPPPPGSPTLLSPANEGKSGANPPTFKWTEVNYDDGGYELRLDNHADFSSPELAIEVDEGVVEFTPEGQINGGKLYWQVRAKNANDDCGAWSSVSSFTQYPSFDTQFNTDGDFEGWQPLYGNWSVNDGYLLKDTHYIDHYMSVQYGDLDYVDFTYSAKMSMGDITEYEGENFYGLVFRGTPSFNGYHDWRWGYYYGLYQVKYNGSPILCLTIEKHLPGEVYYFDECWYSVQAPYDISWSDDNVLRVVAEGSLFTLFVNGHYWTTIMDTEHVQGKLAVVAYEDGYRTARVDWAIAKLVNLQSNSLRRIVDSTPEPSQVIDLDLSSMLHPNGKPWADMDQ